jgi:acetyl esterase/lipase
MILDLCDIDVKSPLLTPFNAHDHRDLPPTYYQIAGTDAWRDSAILYTSMLNQHGVATKQDIYPGLPHTFWAFYPQLAACDQWATDLLNGVKWVLVTGIKQSSRPSRL